jgi:hypothetical protein
VRDGLRENQFLVAGNRTPDTHAIVAALHFQFVDTGFGGELDELTDLVYGHGN